MVVCGISGRGRQAAAALCIDGRLVAAAEEAPLSRAVNAARSGSGWPIAAIDACAVAAGVSVRDISAFVHAAGYVPTLERGPSHRRLGRFEGTASAHRISRLAAFAHLARAAGAAEVLIADGPAAMFVGADGQSRDLTRARDLLALACRLATALGLDHDDSAGAVAALEQLAATHEFSGQEWFEGLSGLPEANAAMTTAAFDAALVSAAAEAGAPLGDVSASLVRRARVVADVAAAFLAVLAEHFAQLAATAPSVMLAGGIFASPDFVARIGRAAGRALPVAPCPSPHGAALGAALSGGAIAAQPIPAELTLGPTATEHEAKAVLENCRLDYLYEPRWPRLLERVSRVLERGKLVAWFQGRAEFGHPFYGSRSYLCDPSHRYARDNINVFLRRVPVSTPIPLSVAFAARECVDLPEPPSLNLMRAAVGAQWRDRLRGGIDHQGFAHVHVPREGSSLLADLLATHHQRTGVPALANLPLCAPDDVVAVSARDAVRAAFASSADALVIHRFVVMKDYWQMRDAS